MHHSLAGIAVAAAMSLSSAAFAEEPQSLSVSNAMPACYVDTWQYDYLTAYACTANDSPPSTVVAWAVLGLDQTTDRYIIEFHDSCYGHGYSQELGWSCFSTISKYQTLAMRMRVYDNWTGQWSGIIIAQASYYGND